MPKAIRKDYHQLATEYNMTPAELDTYINDLIADYDNGDLSGPVIVVDEREADGTPWTVIVYPDGETYNNLK